MSNAVRERRVRYSYHTVEGERLRVARAGDASPEVPPLLILNGIGSPIEVVEPLMRCLERPSVTFDLPGVGGSKSPNVLRRLSGYAELTCDLLDALAIPQVDVLGVSWGGGLAQQIAYEHPACCRRLILAATATGHLMVPGNPMALLRMATPMRYLSSSYFRRVAGSLYGGDFRDDAELSRNHAKRMTPPSGAGYWNQLFAVFGWTSLFWLHRIEQPTLVMAGEDDPLVPLINARILASRIPNARLETFDCGHLFLLTRMQRSVEVMESFLGE